MTQPEQGPEIRGVDVSKFGTKPVERPADLTAVEQLASPLKELSHELMDLMSGHPDVVSSTRLIIMGKDSLAGQVIFKGNPTGSIEITVEGELGRGLPKIPKGNPRVAEMDGTVSQLSPGGKLYGKSGEMVAKDAFVLWFVATNKDTQFGIPAPATGIITYVVENGQAVKAEVKELKDGKEEITQEATILFYIDPESPEKS